MRLLSTDDYIGFKCIGGKCLLSCCSGWNIVVDEDTFKHYSSVEGKFGDELRAGLIKKAGVTVFKLKGNFECFFLNEDGLCRIYRELGGEDALCVTCKKFPRGFVEIGDLMVCYLDNACPEVNRILLEKRDCIKTLYDDSNEDGKIVEYDIKRLDQTIKIMATGIQLLQNRELALGDRMSLIVVFLSTVQDSVEGKEEFNEIVRLFNDEEFCSSLLEDIEDIGKDYSYQIRAFRIVLGVILSDSCDHPMWKLCIELTGKIANNDLLDNLLVKEAYESLTDEDMSIEFEQLLVHRYFAVIPRAFDDSNYMNRVVREIVLLAALRSFIALRGLEDEGNCSLSDRALFYAVCSRIEHSKKQSAELDKAIKKEGFGTFEGIIRLCRV